MEDTADFELKKSYVQKQACFSRLTAEETDQLATLFIKKDIPKGTTIVTEGDSVDSVYLIVSGIADVRHVTVKDHKLHVQSLAKLGEGTAIGLNETGFYSLSGIRTATVVADTDIIAFRLSIAQFHGFALAYPHVNEVMRTNAKEYLGEQPN